MVRISLCDDDDVLNEELKNIIGSIRSDIDIFTYTSGEALLDSEYLFNDIIILDIEMEGINGIEAAKQMRTNGYQGILIFATSHRERVFDSFQVKPYQYILKPFVKDELQVIIHNALLELDSKRKNYFDAVSSTHTYRIPLNEIYYFESQGRNININTKKGVIRIIGKMNKVESSLKNKFFFRCHKGYLVNLEHIYEFNNSEITLSDNQKVLMSRLKVNLFKNTFKAFMKGNIKC